MHQHTVFGNISALPLADIHCRKNCKLAIDYTSPISYFANYQSSIHSHCKQYIITKRLTQGLNIYKMCIKLLSLYIIPLERSLSYPFYKWLFIKQVHILEGSCLDGQTPITDCLVTLDVLYSLDIGCPLETHLNDLSYPVYPTNVHSHNGSTIQLGIPI